MQYVLGDSRPNTDSDDFWIAPSADIIGQVTLGNNASIWWRAVLRADNEPISIGEDCNIQDGSVLHTDPGFPLTLRRGVTIGHMCMLHGCTVDDNSLIGIGSIILNGAKIGKNCLIGANSLITENKVIPDNSMVLGSPGKVIKELTPEQIEGLKKVSAGYVARWRKYRDEISEL